MIDNSDIVYDSKYSLLGILTLIGYSIFSAVLFSICWLRFEDIPILVSLFAALMLAIFFGAAMQKIVVERDSFTIVTWRLIPVLRRRKTFLFSEVQSIIANLPLTQRGDYDTREWNFLSSLFFQKREKQNTLIIRKKDGTEVALIPSIYRDAFREALGHIGKLSKIDIKASDDEA